ncbi:MAG TPA: CGNR zinc finger domain-containing protein [Acidimicrobiales bacterium]|nr:CGNR zinc finger domain-containing protein [Acidimicrobiales bacterium]
MGTPADLPVGGAPLLGEPLPIELANTIYAVQGSPRDGLGSPGNLGAWLRDNRTRFRVVLDDADLLGVDAADLRSARRLRDAVHAVLTAVVGGGQPPEEAVETVNRAARAVPRWSQLRWDGGAAIETTTRGPAVAAALSEVAEATVQLVAGPHRGLLRACPGPGCVLFFVKSHPRRTWCSDACGNRARVARFHARRLGEQTT